MEAPKALKEWRTSLELSQTEAAARLGVSNATWCDWEQGNKSPTVDRAVDLEKETEGAVTIKLWADFTRSRRGKRAKKAKKASAAKGKAV